MIGLNVVDDAAIWGRIVYRGDLGKPPLLERLCKVFYFQHIRVRILSWQDVQWDRLNALNFSLFCRTIDTLPTKKSRLRDARIKRCRLTFLCGTSFFLSMQDACARRREPSLGCLHCTRVRCKAFHSSRLRHVAYNQCMCWSGVDRALQSMLLCSMLAPVQSMTGRRDVEPVAFIPLKSLEQVFNSRWGAKNRHRRRLGVKGLGNGNGLSPPQLTRWIWENVVTLPAEPGLRRKKNGAF